MEKKSLLSHNPVNADGIITTELRTPIYVLTADCLPVLFYGSSPYDPIAAIHCGWRGAFHGIVQEAVRLLKIPSPRLHVILGPSIGPCCMEVKQDFIDKFETAGHSIHTYLIQKNGCSTFNLPEYVVQTQLREIPPTQIDRSHNHCTYCSTPPLPSFRRNGDTRIRLKNWICKA